MNPIRMLALLAFPFFVTSCVVFPTYKTTHLSSEMTVIDERSTPIEGATVTLISNFKPHGQAETRQVKITDKNGKAAFAKQAEWQAESLMIHGMKFYYWRWCVQNVGFKTYQTNYSSAEKFEQQPTVQLLRGNSSDCPEQIL